jgi:hypothetical protein
MDSPRERRFAAGAGNSISPYDIFGEYRLTKTEDRQAFNDLLLKVESDIQPKKTLEYLIVREIAIKLWEVERFRRTNVGLTDSPTALAEFLKLVLGYEPEKAMNVALKYFSPDPEKRKKAEQLLAGRDITPEMIEAHATGQNSSAIKLIYDLVCRHERARDRLIGEAVTQISEKSERQTLPVGRQNDEANEGHPRAGGLVRKRFSLVQGRRSDGGRDGE